MDLEQLCAGIECPVCGKRHEGLLKHTVIEKGALYKTADEIKKYNAKKVFLLADKNTYRVAGEKVEGDLSEKGISVSKFVFDTERPTPSEYYVGSALMHYDASCELIVAVGSGVVNDIGKILASTAKVPYIIVATAPSMDGYASASSSMERDGLKISLASKCPEVIIGDIDVLKNAPLQMLRSGLGDMLAKYVSICEWRIAQIIVGEYYCETVAQIVREALKKCVDNAEALMKRDENAVQAVFEGLVISGVAMNYAGLSRPASGMEHYISHVWDMRGLEFGTSVDLHGIQCAIGTLITIEKYEKLKKLTVLDVKKAISKAEKFDYNAWSNELRALLGKSAETMIELEKKEGKYSVEKRAKRTLRIAENWDKIIEIVNEELPSSHQISELLDAIDAPKTPSDIGIDEAMLPTMLCATRDIRDKYVLSGLVRDLGMTEEIFGYKA